MISIRPFERKDLRAILDMTERSDSTNRSLDTWEGNNMTAVVAFDDNKLIGVLPLERRSFSLGGHRLLNILWISGAHVEKKYRNKGIGTAMDQEIREYFFPEYKAMFVYRGDETSAAYRWYKKLGYHEMLSNLSFKKDVKQPDTKINYILWETEEKIQQWGSKLYDCFRHNVGSNGGFPRRHRQFWSDKLKTHYYKEFYNYSILALTRQDEILSYAFLGETSIKNNISRIDILEFITPEDDIIKNSLYNAIMDFANQHGFNEVRIQLSVQDPHLKWIKSLGFVNRWRFNMMGRLIDPISYFKDCLSEKIDLQRDYQFIIQTPTLGEHLIGTGKRSVKLFLPDSLLNEILLCRCNISNAVEEGKIVIVDGNENNINVLENHFPLNKWRFFHIDYI